LFFSLRSLAKSRIPLSRARRMNCHILDESPVSLSTPTCAFFSVVFSFLGLRCSLSVVIRAWIHVVQFLSRSVSPVTQTLPRSVLDPFPLLDYCVPEAG